MSKLEIVDFSLKSGRIVQCAKRGQVLIQLDRVTIYGFGRVKFAEREELEQLRKERRRNQAAFSKVPEKRRKLDKLARKEENQRKSRENLQAIKRAGMIYSAQDIQIIIQHLLDVGTTVTASTAGGAMLRSQIKAPNGGLTILTGWRIFGDGTIYMITIHFIPPKHP
jgi:hypothetical protein